MGNTIGNSYSMLQQAQIDREREGQRELYSFINDDDLPLWLREVHENYHFDLKKSNTPDFAADLTFVLEHGRLPSHLSPLVTLSRSLQRSHEGQMTLDGGGKGPPSARWWVSSNKGGLYTKSKSRRKYKRKKTKRKRRRITSRK